MRQLKAALFDLDGVIFDTEPQYDIFWGQQFEKRFPDRPQLAREIKGQTLVQILDRLFPDGGHEEDKAEIVQELDAFEAQMPYEYVDGVQAFVADLRLNGVKTAVVTSSNHVKMDSVRRARPDFDSQFDAVLTSEDFAESKPSPDCYLRAAARFGASPDECVVFEDSFNGLRSGQAAKMFVVGLATTNPREKIVPLSDCQTDDFKHWDFATLTAKCIVHNS